MSANGIFKYIFKVQSLHLSTGLMCAGHILNVNAHLSREEDLATCEFGPNHLIDRTFCRLHC